MRCEHDICPQAWRLRVMGDEDRRCRREARVFRRYGAFCREHDALARRTHERLVERIRSIPPRDML